MKGENFLYQVADGKVKISGEDQDLRTSTLIQDRPDRGEEQDNLRGELEGSSSTPRQDSSWYDGEAKGDFWSVSGDFIYGHHVEPRVKLYVPTEGSVPTPLKYIDVTRTTETTLDVMSEKHIAWRGFTRFIALSEKTLDGQTWSGEARKQTTSRPGNVWSDMWKHMSDASKRKEKQKRDIEKPKLDNARRLRGIFFSEPDDEEVKRIMKNVRRKLKIPMPAGMPCRLQLHQHRRTCGTVGQHKTKYACIVEADESMRIRMEGSQSKNHKDAISLKRGEVIDSLQSCAQLLFLCLKP